MSKVFVEMILNLLSNLVNMLGVACLVAGALALVTTLLGMLINSLGGTAEVKKPMALTTPSATKAAGAESEEKKPEGASSETPPAAG